MTGRGDLSWAPFEVAGNEVAVTLTLQGGSTTEATTWSGPIPNAPHTRGGNEYRVRIEQFEQFQDSSGATGLRPVYLDTFPIRRQERDVGNLVSGPR